MQMSIDEIKKIRKSRFFRRLKASNPIISPTVTFFPAEAGGVLGRKKENIPKSAEAIEAIINVLDNVFSFSQLSQPITKPATIQPIVPHTRIQANCFSVSVSWRKETELTSANVGMYKIMYARISG